MDIENKQDGAEPTPASTGSVEPVAWAVTPTGEDEEIDCEFVYPSAATAGDVALDSNGRVVPLYSHPQPALTAAEREAIEQAAIRVAALCQRGSQHMAATLRGLLDRLGGGE